MGSILTSFTVAYQKPNAGRIAAAGVARVRNSARIMHSDARCKAAGRPDWVHEIEPTANA
jgi:hypothetical protein